MDPSLQIEPARIDELLAAFRELQSQFERVRECLRRAEDNRHTVPRRIYDRVRDEYDRELDSIRMRMSPLRDELDRVHESIEAQRRDAGSVIRSVEDELAEADFRHRIGEYEGDAYANLRTSLDARADEARTRHALFEATMNAIAAMRRPDAFADESAPVEDAVAEPVAAPAGTPAGTEEIAPAAEPDTPPAASPPAEDRPVLNARTARPIERGDGFENPHDWITDDAPTPAPARADRRARPQAPAPAPAAAPADELDSALEPLTAVSDDYPSLVFVSGVHAGQAIPLLPTSLTIGREHDNNIEIKDPEVARYHARILRDRGHYVVEDLSSSTGTWVNGGRTQRAVLSHGDVIRVGQTELALDFEWTDGAG